MHLTKCENPAELTSFLKLDYANNLYFFTYLNDTSTPADNQFLIAKYNNRIVLALLLTPIHCCISALNTQYIYAIADQLPTINSIHVVGRWDQVKLLLNLSQGPERDQHIYSFGSLIPGVISYEQTTNSQPASKHHLNDLIEFYSNNDMLIDAENRLPAILSRGRAYFVRQENKIVSCALTTTETNDAAMIGAVYTSPEYRTHGYAKDCLLNLYRALIADYKQPYLFYQANKVLLRNIYGSLGFNQTSIWLLATKKPNLNGQNCCF